MAEALGVLETVGKVAGVGGLAITAMVLVFRDLIRKKIFPMLPAAQAYRLLRLIVLCVATISLAGLAAWAFVTLNPGPGTGPKKIVFPKESSQPVMAAHLQLIDAGKYEEAWDGLSKLAHETMNKDMMISSFMAVRAPLGAVVDRQPRGMVAFTKLPSGFEGAFSKVTYISKFANGQTHVEELLTVGEDLQWKMLYHTINPCLGPSC